MNTLTAPRPAVPGPARAVTPRQHRRRRRWLRAVLPFAVVLLLIAVSAIAFHVVNGSPGDADYLSPGSTADHGAARLATLLTAKGTAVERVAHSSDALVSAYRGDATLFLPTPSLMHPFYLRMLKLLPSSTTVVLVAPNSRELADGHLPVGVADQELATFPASPQCADPVAAKAGSADLDRVHYTRPDGPFQTALYRCYSGALVGVRWHDTELTLVGAADPFRNDRIDEVGNARLATGLLTRRSRMIWLDLHEAEPPPRLITDPNATAGAGAPASLGPGSPDPDFPIAGTAGPGDRPHRPRGGGWAPRSASRCRWRYRRPRRSAAGGGCTGARRRGLPRSRRYARRPATG